MTTSEGRRRQHRHCGDQCRQGASATFLRPRLAQALSVGSFRKLWPDRQALTRAPKVGADGAASRYFWEWRSGQKRKLGRLSDSSLTNDRPLVDAFVVARPIFPTGPGRTFHSTR